MSSVAVETFETRRRDTEGWPGVPFRHPRDLEVGAEDEGGKHDGGPMPPEAPRDPSPQPSGGESK
ncbi:MULTISPECIES: hypothetical protein [unclassified Streptomyces]|uniref:hypothetical protein n=1 Tax=unclassified Streptomyces TaxID=2593676 RepID=UPI0003706EEC|nr:MULTISPECIES: hypothetical protein [unclassified Streptomyces]MYT33282.1 hypothetical protein [Streptomyces sp. SID8354]